MLIDCVCLCCVPVGCLDDWLGVCVGWFVCGISRILAVCLVGLLLV